MVNKFLVFVVFGIVTPSSVLLSPAVFDTFSEKDYAALDQLYAADLMAREKSFHGFVSFVNLLKNGTLQDLSPLADALSIVVESIDIIYYSTLIIARGDCDGLEIALNETRAQLKLVTESLISSFLLAQGGSYEENRSAIEYNQNMTKTRLVNAYATLSEFQICCISDSTDEFNNLINEVKARVDENIHLIIEGLNELIKARSIITSACSEDEAIAALISMDRSLLMIMIPVVDNIEHIFSLHETSYILAHVKCKHIAHGVYAIRLARKKTADKLVEVMKVIFLAITERLLQHTSHNETGSRNTTLDDPTRDLAVDLILGAEEHFLQAVLLTLPNSVDNAIVGQILLPHILEKVIDHYYNAMDIAEADSLPYNSSLSAIESLNELQTLIIDFVVEKCFEIIGSDVYTQVRLEVRQNRVMSSLEDADNAVFDAMKTLAKAAHANGGATDDNFNQVMYDRSAATEAVSNAAGVQLHAVLYKYLVENKCHLI